MAYDYGFRIYDPSIARFMSVDPLTGSYPMLTPFQFASNTPIQAIDLDGLEAFVAYFDHFEGNEKPVLTFILDKNLSYSRFKKNQKCITLKIKY